MVFLDLIESLTNAIGVWSTGKIKRGLIILANISRITTASQIRVREILTMLVCQEINNSFLDKSVSKIVRTNVQSNKNSFRHAITFPTVCPLHAMSQTSPRSVIVCWNIVN